MLTYRKLKWHIMKLKYVLLSCNRVWAINIQHKRMGRRKGKGFIVRRTNKRYEEWNAGEEKEGDNCTELSVNN